MELVIWRAEVATVHRPAVFLARAACSTAAGAAAEAE
jgi:hypothetical protein